MSPAPDPLAAAFSTERTRCHAAILPGSMAASALMAMALVAANWGSSSTQHSLVWLVGLLLTLCARYLVGWLQARRRVAVDQAPVWLRRHRIGFAAHGIMWAIGSLLLLSQADQQQANYVAVGLIAMAAGSLILVAFDVTASSLFAGFALGPLLLHFLQRSDTQSINRVLMVALLLAAALAAALRIQRLIRDAIRLRLEMAEKTYLLPVLLDRTQQGYWFIDQNGLTKDVNPAMCELLGRPREAILGRSVFDFFQGDDLRQLSAQIEARRKGGISTYEVGLTRPDGSRRYCMNHATPVQDPQGAFVGSIGLWTDISARREAELALRSYAIAINSINDLVSVVNEDLVYQMVNDAWCRECGQKREDVLGRSAGDFLPSSVKENRQEALRRCMHQQQIQVVRDTLALPGLPSRPVETTYYPHTHANSNARSVVMVTRDVTVEEESRQQLAASAEYLRRTLNATGEGIFASEGRDPTRPLRFVNDQMLQLWGIPANKAGTLTAQDIMSYATPQFAEPEVEVRLVARIIEANAEHTSKVRLRDGRILLRRCAPAMLGEQVLRVWSFRDITTEEQSLTVVQRSEAQQRALIEAFPGFIARLNHQLVYTHVNERLALRLGTTPVAMIGRSAGELFGEQREAELRSLIGRSLEGEVVSYERDHEKPDGSKQTDQITLATGFDPGTGEPVVYSFGIDISARKLAERQLREATEQLARTTADLQLTLDHIDQGFVSMHDDGRIGVYNRRILELLNLPASLLARGAPYQQAIDYQAAHGDLEPDRGFVDIDGVRHYFQGGEDSVPDHYVRRTREGVVVEVRTHRLPAGGMVRTFSDVTPYFNSQQSLREVEAELRALLDAFPGYISAIRQDLIYTYLNDRFASMIGVSARDTVGKSVLEVLGQDGAERALAQSRLAIGQGPRVLQVDYPATPERSRLELEVTYVAGQVRASGEQTFYAFGLDITTRRAAEEALVAARDTAESASRAKSEFLASMSHELRTPLNAILGFSQLLAADTQLPATTRGDAQEIERAGKHLLALVNDVIDLARIETGKLELTMGPVLPLPLIAQCVDMIAPVARRQGINVKNSCGAAQPGVLADPVRLRQVLLNLLSNAIKYNRPQGQVVISCDRHDHHLRIEIADTGVGIPADQRERVFNAFERLGAERGQIEGAGIGLVITKRIVEAMGASIDFESEPGVGTRFWVDLPLTNLPTEVAADVDAISDKPAPASGERTSAAGKDRARVLYVEDNIINATIMQRVLHKLGHVDLQIAETAEAALERIAHQAPDLVLMDIHLPGMSGLDAVRLLKADPRTRHIPVIAVSAAAMAGDVEQGLAAGFLGYLTKPFNVEQLLATVDDVLRKTAKPHGVVR